MCLFTKIISQELEFIVKKEIELRDTSMSDFTKFKKGEVVETNTSFIGIGVDNLENIDLCEMKFKKTNKGYAFPIENLILKNNKNVLSNQFKTDFWIPKYYYDQLLQDNRNELMFQNEKFWDKWEICAGDIETWRDDFSVQRFVLGDYFIHVIINTVAWENINFIGYLDKMTDKEFVYNVRIMSTNYSQYIGRGQSYHPEFQFLFEKEKPFNIIFTIDGDFLNMYIDEISKKALFKTLVRSSPEACKQIEDWIAEKSSDLSAVIWPHHTDGTSEYEDTIRNPELVVIEEAEEIEIEEYDNSAKETEKDDNVNLEYDLVIPLKKAFPWPIFFSIIAGIVIVVLCIIAIAKKRRHK